MKLSVILMFIGVLGAHASAFSQKITLQGKGMKLEKVLNEIEQQSNYQFWYEDGLLKDMAPIDINVKDMPLEDVLDQSLRAMHIRWKIVKQTIILSSAANPLPVVPYQVANEVKGIVKDATTGQPLPGASVTLKSSKKSTVTDGNGQFTLTSTSDVDELQITFIGFQTQTVKWRSGTKLLSIMLAPETSKLTELVITGYSSKKIGDLTGAVQKISGDELRRGITTSDPVSLLKGRVTGLYISEQEAGNPNSSGGQIFVRGQSSIVGVGVDQVNQFVMPTQNYGPLLVLDGVIMPNQNLKEIVTPQEIQDIIILKDAAATAIYGSRAAGGVLVINTKRGQQGKPRMTAEVKYGLNHPNRGTLRFLTGQELYDLQKEYFRQDYAANPGLSTQYPTLQAYLDDRLPSQAEVANSFDWQKYGFINSNTKEVNVSASGGTDKSRYYIGAGYYNEQSTGVNNGLKRKTFRINLDNKLTDRLSLNVAMNGIFNDGRQEVYQTGTFLYSYIPWATPYNTDGTLKPYLEYSLNGSTSQTENPIFENQYNYNNVRSQLMFGSARLEYKITDWLTISSTNSANLNYTKNENYIDVRSYAGSGTSFAPKGYLGTTTGYLNSYLSSNQLAFNKTFGDHTLRALAAMEYGKTSFEDIRVNVNNVRAGYPVISLGRLVGGSYDLSIYGIPSTKAGNIEGGKQDRAQFSALGEVGYTYRERYSLSGSLRTDASSSFGRDRRYGTFYSIGGAWIISSEQFLQNSSWLSNLKLRANYGTSGSQLGDNFLTRTLYRPGSTYAGQGAATIAVLGNPDLRWEVTKTLSTGIDLGLFKRVTASVDLYNRLSQDLLQQVTMPAISGFETQWRNVASVKNQGLEILINSENIVRKNFRWTMQFNVSFNRNQLVSVANDSLRQGFYNANSFYLKKGDDINSLKAVKYAGVDPQTGKPRFEKLIFDDKGNTVGKEYVTSLAEVDAATDPRQFQTIGSFQPKAFGGWSNTFQYKQFTLSTLITFAWKYVMTDNLAEQNQGANILYYNQIAFRKNQKLWTTPGQTDANEPSLYEGNNADYFGSSKYMHDGSHARLRSVRLSYDLPNSLLAHLRLSNCQVYVSGDNLYTLYSKNIVSADPEGPSVGQAQDFGNSVGAGIGAPRRFVFGLQVSL